MFRQHITLLRCKDGVRLPGDPPNLFDSIAQLKRATVYETVNLGLSPSRVSNLEGRFIIARRNPSPSIAVMPNGLGVPFLKESRRVRLPVRPPYRRLVQRPEWLFYKERITVRFCGCLPSFFCPIAQRQCSSLINCKLQIGARCRFESD